MSRERFRKRRLNDGDAYHDLQVDSTFLFSLEVNVGRSFVESDAEAFELVLEDLLVNERLEDVQNDENQAACSGNCNDLFSSTLAVLGALDDAR